MDSLVRLRQVNKPEVSGYILDVFNSFLSGGSVTTGSTGSLTSVFYLKSNPSGFITGFNSGLYVLRTETGDFLTYTDSRYLNAILAQTTALFVPRNESGQFASTGLLSLTGNTISSWTGKSTGLYYPRYENPSGFLTSAQVEHFASKSELSQTGDLLSSWTGESTGIFYPLTGNPHGFLTTASGNVKYVSISGEQIIYGRKTFDGSIDVIGNNEEFQVVIQAPNVGILGGAYIDFQNTVLYGLGSQERLNWQEGVCNDETLNLSLDWNNRILSGDWSAENLSISGQSLLTGNTSNFVTNGQTGNFYPRTGNPSGFITASQTGNFVTTSQTGNFYPRTGNPSGFITASQTGNFASTSKLGLTGSTISSWTGSSTGLYYPRAGNPSEFLTLASGNSRYVSLTGNQTISGNKTFNGAVSVINAPVTPAFTCSTIGHNGDHYFDFQYGVMIHGQGGPVIIDLENGNINSIEDGLSIDWNRRELFESNYRDITLDWGNRRLSGEWDAESLSISGQSVMTGSASRFVTTGQTGSFYPRFGNPSGFITTGQTGAFGSSANLTNVVFTTGNQNISGDKTFKNNLIVEGDGNLWVAIQAPVIGSNADSFIDFDDGVIAYHGGGTSINFQHFLLQDSLLSPSLDWSNRILSGNWSAENLTISGQSLLTGNTSNFVTNGQTGSFYPRFGNPSGFITTGQTGAFGSANLTNVVFTTGSQIISGSKRFINATASSGTIVGTAVPTTNVAGRAFVLSQNSTVDGNQPTMLFHDTAASSNFKNYYIVAGKEGSNNNVSFGVLNDDNNYGVNWMRLKRNNSSWNLFESLEFSVGKIGFNTTPYAQVQYYLEEDNAPAYIYDWDERHVFWGSAGSQGGGLGMSYSEADYTVYLHALMPSIAWQNLRINAESFSFYAGGTNQRIFSDDNGTNVFGSLYLNGDMVVTESQTDIFYPRYDNPDEFIDSSQTGAFYGSHNPSGYITGLFIQPSITGFSTPSILINWSGSSTFHYSLTGNSAFSFTGQRDGQTIVVGIKSTGNYTVNWPSGGATGVKWAATGSQLTGTQPIQSSGSSATPRTDIYTFINIVGSIYGNAVQRF